MSNLIAGEKIVKSFNIGKEQTTILDQVSVEIEREEFVVIMGPSGCGKTTLLFSLSGTDDITSGSIKFDGQEISGLKENQLADMRRQKFGFIFQQPTMLKNLSILDNIILPVVTDNRKNLADVTKKAEQLMKKTGISGLGDREITKVSGGQLQRAGICRALMSSPAILFADEPTGALNSKSADEIMLLLEAINQEGTAILLVTHDAKVAARADRVLFMKDGKILSELAFTEKGAKSFEDRTGEVLEQMAIIGV
ncbi:ABC transporter ATP-binding protein [Enterococcus sp. 669A]|uniref:ABC transporter ATP-binding protein n=1 Tax=Candidatus Enterococcus moelleringii TaxID=2815325 RepID=A0ABS3LCZ2_9ENTE|nr:ABC transporter ATP-binding protein [Enterococcus sp. 669A]MBO1306903.1 ABC transporter ATP-binding protein [Enterococcus sp. 669A]